MENCNLACVSIPPQEQKTLEQETDTSNWQTYRSDEFGFELKYPRDWKIDEGQSIEGKVVFELSILTPERYETIYIETTNQALDEWQKTLDPTEVQNVSVDY
ncbi:MAG: hypothetical protein AAB524_00220 [Patescibacteria group bacterium]